MTADLEITVTEMVREWPVRSAINLVGPQIFSLAQFANSYYYDVSFVYPAVFTVILASMSVLILQRQWSEFYVEQLSLKYMADD